MLVTCCKYMQNARYTQFTKSSGTFSNSEGIFQISSGWPSLSPSALVQSWSLTLKSIWQSSGILIIIFPVIVLWQNPPKLTKSLVISTANKCPFFSYVYWTMHYLDSWIKIDHLDITCFIISLFTAQRVSNVSTSIFRSLRLIVNLFHGLYCSGSMCVGVTVWFGWGGVVSLWRLKHWRASACIRIPHHPSRTTP